MGAARRVRWVGAGLPGHTVLPPPPLLTAWKLPTLSVQESSQSLISSPILSLPEGGQVGLQVLTLQSLHLSGNQPHPEAVEGPQKPLPGSGVMEKAHDE